MVRRVPCAQRYFRAGREGRGAGHLRPSGSGKSSLIRCLNRLEPIQKGDILFEGTSIYAPEVDVNALRAEVGMVFQQFNLYPHLTVLENVTLAPIKVRGMGRKGGHGSGHGTARPRGHRASGRQAPERDFRRAAAACRHRPLARHAAPRHAVRRTHLRPRPGNDQRSVELHEGSGQGRHDHGVRHA